MVIRTENEIETVEAGKRLGKSLLPGQRRSTLRRSWRW